MQCADGSASFAVTIFPGSVMRVPHRSTLLGVFLILLSVAPLAAQRGGGGGRYGGGGFGGGRRGGMGQQGPRTDFSLFDPILLDGPPPKERLLRLVTMSDSETVAYETERSAMMKETAALRDSVQRAPPPSAMAFGGGPRGEGRGVEMDPDTRETLERSMRQRKELSSAQERMDNWLHKLLGKDRSKPYDEWRKEMREAAVAGMRQEMMRRMREEGGGYSP